MSMKRELFIMSGPLIRWRRKVVVGLLVGGVAAGAAFAMIPGGDEAARLGAVQNMAAHGTTTRNLVGNGSAEIVVRQVPKGWAKGSSGANTHVLSSLNGRAQNGRKFVRTRITKRGTGAAWWYTPAAKVTAGFTYTYTEYYRSGSPTAVNAYFIIGGRRVGKRLGTLPASAAWKAARFTVTVPARARSVQFGHVLTSAGYVDVDNVSLVAAPKTANVAPPSTVRGATSPRAAAAGTKGGGLVSLTFDDGWANQATAAGPIMKAANMPGTFYLISGYLGSGSYMSVAQAWQLQAQGSEIGSHTVNHANLATADPATVTRELADSKKALEANFGPVTSFAYPFGAFSPQAQTAAAQYYTSARSTDGGNNVRGQYNRYSLTIGYVLNTTPLSTVQEWLNQAKANNSWLILCYHQIANNQPSDPYTETVANFQAQVNAIRASGLRVVTVRDGIKATS
jgi:peptidoglycan/xylan/chitin deacetylase (PgdA/CDA1 family)